MGNSMTKRPPLQRIYDGLEMVKQAADQLTDRRVHQLEAELEEVQAQLTGYIKKNNAHELALARAGYAYRHNPEALEVINGIKEDVTNRMSLMQDE
jgi:hypothetical protein